jgi:hypothetical protein
LAPHQVRAGPSGAGLAVSAGKFAVFAANSVKKGQFSRIYHSL